MSDTFTSVYVRIGRTVQSPVIGVKLMQGAAAQFALQAAEKIDDMEEAIEKHMARLTQFASGLYFHYIQDDAAAKEWMEKISTNDVVQAAVLLQRLVDNREPGKTPMLMAWLKAPIQGFELRVDPTPPVPPVLQATVTIGDKDGITIH
jgi:hypothetical protein